LIVSGIWWKRVEVLLKALALAPLSLLVGCGIDRLLFPAPTASPPPIPPPSTSSSTSQLDISAGLAPLPTPQQVLTAVPFGRTDPFAPLPVRAAPAPAATAAGGRAQAAAAPPAAAGTPAAATSAAAAQASGGAAASSVPARLVPPEGFQLTGVIRSGGRAEALVSFGPLSGSLRPGDRGGRSTALLPSGWTMAAIQLGGSTPLDPPSVTLQYGGQRVKVRL